jgi:hypothetical protein
MPTYADIRQQVLAKLGPEAPDPTAVLQGLAHAALAAGAAAALPTHIPARPVTPRAHPGRRRPPVRPRWGLEFSPGSHGEKP